MKQFRLTGEQREAFERDGYFVALGRLDADEADLLRVVARADHTSEEGVRRADGEGGAIRLRVENQLDDATLYAALVRAEPVVSAMEQLLGGEVYHWHHKMILK